MSYRHAVRHGWAECGTGADHAGLALTTSGTASGPKLVLHNQRNMPIACMDRFDPGEAVRLTRQHRIAPSDGKRCQTKRRSEVAQDMLSDALVRRRQNPKTEDSP